MSMSGGGIPPYARNAILGQGQGGGMNYGQFGSGVGQFLGGMFGDSGAPFEDAMKQYQEWASKAENAQNPFLRAGQGAIGPYQDWLNRMKDPSGFYNSLMGQYQESPYARYLQQQAERMGINAGSESGMIGSTPWAQQMQQNAAGIASGDMQNWLSQVLGINNQYGLGNQYLMGQGANAANALTGMYGDMGRQMGNAAYQKGAAEGNDWWNTIGGLAQMGLAFI